MAMWSAEHKELAYQAYLQCMSIEGTYRMLGRKVRKETLEKWKREHNWDQKVEADRKVTSESLETDEDLTRLMQKFGMDERHIDTLQELRIVSSVCLSRIMGKGLPTRTIEDGDDSYEEHIGLVPMDFKEALAGLKACWKARTDLMGTIKVEDMDKDKKVDMFESVDEYDTRHVPVN